MLSNEVVHLASAVDPCFFCQCQALTISLQRLLFTLLFCRHYMCQCLSSVVLSCSDLAKYRIEQIFLPFWINAGWRWHWCLCHLHRAVSSRFCTTRASPLATPRCGSARHGDIGWCFLRLQVFGASIGRRCHHWGEVDGRRILEHVRKHPEPTWLFPLQTLNLR